MRTVNGVTYKIVHGSIVQLFGDGRGQHLQPPQITIPLLESLGLVAKADKPNIDSSDCATGAIVVFVGASAAGGALFEFISHTIQQLSTSNGGIQHIALFEMSRTGVAASIDPAFLTSLAIDPSVLATLSALDLTGTALLFVAGGVACVVAGDQLKKYIEEKKKSEEAILEEGELRKAIPGANTYDEKYKADVITSLRRYFDRKRGSEFAVNTFEDFVAKNIITELGIKKFGDLLQQKNINELSRLKSGNSFFGCKKLHIGELKKEFKKPYPNLPEPDQQPSTMVSGSILAGLERYVS